jgi:AP-3 complex subunit delta-1
MMLYPLAPPPSFAFHVVEVMSSPRYHLKRTFSVRVPFPVLTQFSTELGYLAAPMAFSTDTEEVVLTVNGIRKVRPIFPTLLRTLADTALQDLLSPHAHLPPIALAGLSDIITPSLARDVYADVGVLLTHSRPHVSTLAYLDHP